MDNDHRFLNNQISFLFIIIIIITLLFSYLWPRECDDGRHVPPTPPPPPPSHRSPAEKDVRGRNGGRRGDARAVGRRAELVAPLGCVTGSARYLFLIRPDGDDYDGGVGPGEV